jgi:hypothetical protein
MQVVMISACVLTDLVEVTVIYIPDDDAQAQSDLERERMSQSAAVVAWAAEAGMPSDLLTHLIFELGLVEREQNVEFKQF